MPLSWIQSFHSMFLNSVSKTDLFLSNNGMAASLKQKKNGIVILNQTTNGLKLESIQLLLAVVFSSASNQKPLFRYYSSVYKIFCPLWKNNYISDYCWRPQTLNTLIYNHPQDRVSAAATSAYNWWLSLQPHLSARKWPR